MLLAYIMLKLLKKFESNVVFKAFQIIRHRSKCSSSGSPSGNVWTDAKTLDDIEIIHNSPHFLVINKSYDVLVNHMNQNRKVTVEKQLERLYPDLVNATLDNGFYFCHRLDYATSGVLCIAKHRKSAAAAAKAFSERTSQKYYLAIVRGLVSEDTLTISEGIGDDTRENYRNVRMACQSSPFCSKFTRDAKTDIVVLERGVCYDYPATKILMRPHTGRRHQLRLHCCHIGHTIVGDYTYSNGTDSETHRMFLHAYKLILPCEMEYLNVSTADPFTSYDIENKWLPHSFVNTISSALAHLDEKSSCCEKIKQSG